MAKKKLPDNTMPQSPTTKSIGDWGERVAMQLLVSLGYAIVEQQWRLNHMEIDIIASKGSRVVFVEVKTRKNDDIDPVEAVDRKKREYMIRAADAYLKRLNLPLDYQFDIIAVTGSPSDYKVTHIPDAFFPTPRCRTSFQH